MLRPVMALFRKEWLDAIRDRRTISGVLAIVIGFPLFYGAIIGLVQKRADKDAERPIRLIVQSCDNLVEICNFLLWNGVELQEPVADISEALLAGDIDVALLIPDESIALLEKRRKLNFRIDFHQSHERSLRASARLEGLLMQYRASLASRQLISFGISPESMTGFVVDKKAIKAGNYREYLMGTLFISILMGISFLVTLQYGNDSIAGEKDRGTLEPLLNMAVPRSVILLGKWLILVVIVTTGASLAALVFRWMGEVTVLQKVMGLYGSLSWQQIILGLLIFFPIFLLAPILQLLVSTYSRSMREAQTYSSLLVLGAILPTAFLDSFADKDWSAFVPLISQALALRNFYRGSPIEISSLIFAEVLTVFLALLTFAITIRLLKSELVLRTQ